MKKGSKLKSILIGVACIAGTLMPSFSQAQYKTEAPVKDISVVSSNVVPVKTLTKTIDYSTMKPVQELQTETVSYTTPQEGFGRGLTYVPAEDFFYDENSSEVISNNTDNSTTLGYEFANPFMQHYWKHGGDVTNPTFIYASGDVNQDGVTNRDDLPLVPGSNLDEADLDGINGPGTQDDYNVLESWLKNQIPYLPHNFELHKTEAEKISWHEKMIAIDNTNTLPLGDCDYFSYQTEINTDGTWNLSGAPLNWDVLDSLGNGDLNYPVCQVETRYQNWDAHRINAVLVGADPLEFTDWYLFEPQTDQRQYGGDPSVNDIANFKNYAYFESPITFQFVYSLEPIVNFDLDNVTGQPLGPGVPRSGPIPLVLTKPEKFNYIHIEGHASNDTVVDYPSTFRGEVIGEADWATAYSSMDSTTQTGGEWDYTKYNFEEYTKLGAESDSSMWIDTVYTALDNFYGMPTHKTIVQDTTKSDFTYVYDGTPMLYSAWASNGIPASEGEDNCGVFAIGRRQISGQGPEGTCSFLEFTDVKRDSIYDPSHNWRITDISTPVSLDDHYWTYSPPGGILYYEDEQIVANTGGVWTAENPTGIDVLPDQNPPILNSTYSGDSLSPFHYNAGYDILQNSADTMCYDTIEGLQHITIYKPNALVCTNLETIQDTFYIGENEIIDPSLIWEPIYQDTLETWFPTFYTYGETVINVTPTDSIVGIDFTGHENICNTTMAGPSYIVKKDIITGINESGLEKRTKNIFLPYPNPTHSGKMNVKINPNFENIKNIYWEAYDMIGRLVDFSKEQISPEMKEFKVDLSKNANGIYSIVFTGDDGTKLLEVDKVMINKR